MLGTHKHTNAHTQYKRTNEQTYKRSNTKTLKLTNVQAHRDKTTHRDKKHRLVCDTHNNKCRPRSGSERREKISRLCIIIIVICKCIQPYVHYTFGRKHKTQKTDFGQYDEVAFLACFLIPPQTSITMGTFDNCTDLFFYAHRLCLRILSTIYTYALSSLFHLTLSRS